MTACRLAGVRCAARSRCGCLGGSLLPYLLDETCLPEGPHAECRLEEFAQENKILTSSNTNAGAESRRLDHSWVRRLIHGFAVPWELRPQGWPLSEPALQASLRRHLRLGHDRTAKANGVGAVRKAVSGKRQRT